MEKTNRKITIEMEGEDASFQIENMTASEVVGSLSAALIKFSKDNGIPSFVLQSVISESYDDFDNEDNHVSSDSTDKSDKNYKTPTVDDLIKFLKSVSK